METLKKDIKDLEGLKRPLQEMSRLSTEIDDLGREIRSDESQLGNSSGSVSGAEIRAKMDSLNDQRTKLRREQKSVGIEKEKSMMRVQGLREQLSSLKYRISEGENKLNAKKGFERDLEDARAAIVKANEDIQVWSPDHRYLS